MAKAEFIKRYCNPNDFSAYEISSEAVQNINKTIWMHYNRLPKVLGYRQKADYWKQFNKHAVVLLSLIEEQPVEYLELENIVLDDEVIERHKSLAAFHAFLADLVDDSQRLQVINEAVIKMGDRKTKDSETSLCVLQNRLHMDLKKEVTVKAKRNQIIAAIFHKLGLINIKQKNGKSLKDPKAAIQRKLQRGKKRLIGG